MGCAGSIESVETQRIRDIHRNLLKERGLGKKDNGSPKKCSQIEGSCRSINVYPGCHQPRSVVGPVTVVRPVTVVSSDIEKLYSGNQSNSGNVGGGRLEGERGESDAGEDTFPSQGTSDKEPCSFDIIEDEISVKIYTTAASEQCPSEDAKNTEDEISVKIYTTAALPPPTGCAPRKIASPAQTSNKYMAYGLQTDLWDTQSPYQRVSFIQPHYNMCKISEHYPLPPVEITLVFE